MAETTDKEKKYPDWWYQSPYQKELNNLAGQIANRPDFRFKVDQEAMYNYYKGEYDRQGREAKLDAQARGAALTDGHGNSYARRAGDEAYEGYMEGLQEDVVPELWQMALDKYTQEGEALADRYSALQKQENQAYKQWEKDHKDQIEEWEKKNETDNLRTPIIPSLVQQNAQAGLSPSVLSRFDNIKDSWIERNKPTVSDAYQEVDTAATRSFKGSVMTRREFSRTGDTYTSYEDYLAQMIDQRLSKGELTDDEAATLMQHYGLV